jgi:hypothetical protein
MPPTATARTATGAGEAQHVHDHQAVAPGGRVVVEAVEQELVDRAPDALVRGLDQPQAQVARRVLDAVEVARQPARRRQHDHARRVRVLAGLGVVGVAEADRVGQRADLELLADQEAPAVLGGGTVVLAQVALALRARERWGLLGVDADGDHAEVLARVQRDRAQRGDEPVQDQVAEHRALVVDERKHGGLRAEELAQAHLPPGLVAEARVERHALAEALVEPDRRAQVVGAGRLGGGAGAQRGRREPDGRAAHRWASLGPHRASSADARAGRPSSRTSSIARSIGTRTRPSAGSTHP